MIKPHHWPQIEFFSSGGQESWHLLCSATAFQRGHSSAPRINACHPLCSVMKQIRLRCFEVSLFPVCNRGVILSICEITSYSPEVIKFSYPSSRSLVQLDRWRRHLASMWPCVSQGLSLWSSPVCRAGWQSCCLLHTYHRDQMREQMLKCFENIESFTV